MCLLSIPMRLHGWQPTTAPSPSPRGASDDAAGLGFTNEDVRDVLRALRGTHARFYKSMESDDRPGQRIRRVSRLLAGARRVSKFIDRTRRRPPRDRCIVVTSFKEQ